MCTQLTIWDCIKPVVADDHLTDGMRLAMIEGGEIRIYALYKHEKDASVRVRFLRREYGIGGRTIEFSDGTRGFVDYDSKGVHISIYTPEFEVKDDKTTYSWPEAEKRVKKLIDEGRYLSEKGKQKWASLAKTPYPEPCYAYPPR